MRNGRPTEGAMAIRSESVTAGSQMKGCLIDKMREYQVYYSNINQYPQRNFMFLVGSSLIASRLHSGANIAQ